MLASILLALGSIFVPALSQNFNITSETSVTDQSADFNLVIQSRNKTLDGQLLGACHDGAAHEGVCIVGRPSDSLSTTDNYVSFQFNTTRNVCTGTNSSGTFIVPCNGIPTDPALQAGIVTWYVLFSPLVHGIRGAELLRHVLRASWLLRS